MPPRARALIFDLGGVLVDWNPRHLFRKIFPGDEARMEWFLANVCTMAWNGCLDEGVSFEENVRLLLPRFPEFSSAIHAWLERWEEMFNGEIAESVRIFREVKAEGYPVYALTNWSKETWPRAQKLFPFFSEFDGIVVSGDVGFKKPDVRIFEHTLKTFGLRPSETLFVDDIQTHVAVARSLGIQAILYENPGQLRAALSAEGVLALPAA